MNAPQGIIPTGPATYNADEDMVIPADGAGILVKRTATGVAICAAGEYPFGVVFDDVDADEPVAVHGLGLARFPLVASGALATIGTWVIPAAAGKVQSAAAPIASLHLLTDSVAADGELVYVVSGCC